MSVDLRKMRRQRLRGSRCRSFTNEEWEQLVPLRRFLDGVQDALGADAIHDVTAEFDPYSIDPRPRVILRWRVRPR